MNPNPACCVEHGVAKGVVYAYLTEKKKMTTVGLF